MNVGEQLRRDRVGGGRPAGQDEPRLDLVDPFAEGRPRAVGVESARGQRRQVGLDRDRSRLAIGEMPELEHPRGDLVGAHAQSHDQLVEPPADLAGVRPGGAPRQLLDEQGEVDQVDDRRLELVGHRHAHREPGAVTERGLIPRRVDHRRVSVQSRGIVRSDTDDRFGRANDDVGLTCINDPATASGLEACDSHATTASAQVKTDRTHCTLAATSHDGSDD